MKTEKFVIDKIELDHTDDTPSLILTIRLSSRVWEAVKGFCVGDTIEVPVEKGE